jgi:hypothetical protein
MAHRKSETPHEKACRQRDLVLVQIASMAKFAFQVNPAVALLASPSEVRMLLDDVNIIRGWLGELRGLLNAQIAEAMAQNPVKIAGCALCKESFKSLPGRFTAVCCQDCIESKALGLLERAEASSEELGVA